MSTNKLRGASTYLAGVLTGAAIAGALYFGQHPSLADTPAVAKVYVDVPANHWATLSIADLKQKGIVTGAPTDTFRGDQYVTRYEAAVLIDRFVHYVENGRKPLNATTADPKTLPSISPGYAKESLNDLASNNFITPDSPLLAKPGTKFVTADQFALSMAQVIDRLNDRAIAPQPS